MELLITGLLLGCFLTLAGGVAVWFLPRRICKPPDAPAVAPQKPEDEQKRRERESFLKELNAISNYTGKPPGGGGYGK